MTPVKIELISNLFSAKKAAAGSPELMDLSDAMDAVGLESSFQKHTYNPPQSTSQGKSQSKDTSAEAILASTCEMLRGIFTVYNRGLHFHITNLMIPSAGFILARILCNKGVPVFITGLNSYVQTKLGLQVDLSFTQIPVELLGLPSMQEEFLQKSKRSLSFYNTVRILLNLPILPEEVREKCQTMLEKKGKVEKYLNETEIINIGIIADYISRYQDILDQFIEAFFHKSTSRFDLTQFFNLLTYGIPLSSLKKRLNRLNVLKKEEDISSKEKLIYFLKKYLTSLSRTAPEIKNFLAEFQGLFYLQRFQHDPGLLHTAHFLETKSSEETKFTKQRREFFAELNELLLKEKMGSDHDELPFEAKCLLFKELLSLIFQGSFRDNPEGKDLSPPEILSRETLQSYQLICMLVIDARSIQSTPNIRGLARVYAGQYSVRWGEVPLFLRTLRSQINPLEEALLIVRDKILEKRHLKEQHIISKYEETYIEKSFALLPRLNFSFQFAPTINRFERNALMASAIQIGIEKTHKIEKSVFQEPLSTTVVKSKMGKSAWEEIQFKSDFLEIFPQDNPEWVLKAYQSFLENSVIQFYRNITQGKEDYLFQTHTSQFFYHTYNNLIHIGNIYISYHQFAKILMTRGILSKKELAKLGYQEDFAIKDPAYRDIYYDLSHLKASTDEFKKLISNEAYVEKIRMAFRKFGSLYQSLKVLVRKASDVEAWLVKQIFRLHKKDIFDLFSYAAKEVLITLDAVSLFRDEFAKLVQKNQVFLNKKQETHVVYLFPEFELLELFQIPDSSVSVELEGEETFHFHIEYNQDKKIERFDRFSQGVNEDLVTLKNDPNDPAKINTLLKLGRLISYYQERWLEVQRSCSLVLIKELLKQTCIKEVQTPPPALNQIKEIHDLRKLILVKNTKSFEDIDYNSIFQKLPGKHNFQFIGQFIWNIGELKKISQKMHYYGTLLGDYGKTFSLLPSIKHAPKHVKTVRKKIRVLKKLFGKEIEDISLVVLEEISDHAKEFQESFNIAVAEEVSVPIKYRYITRSITKFKYQRTERVWEELLNITKQARHYRDASKGSLKETKTGTFFIELEKLVQFREVLEEKEYIFIYPSQIQAHQLKLCVENLLYFKGFHSKIFVDGDLREGMFESLLAFLPPQKIISLQ